MAVTEITPTFLAATFDEAEASGALSVPGLKAGDVMLSLSSVDTTGAYGSGSLMSLDLYESVVSTDDQLVQNASTTAPGNTFTAIFLRA